MWRSLVAHLTGGQGVAGSNPVIPTNNLKGKCSACKPAVCGYRHNIGTLQAYSLDRSGVRHDRAWRWVHAAGASHRRRCGWTRTRCCKALRIPFYPASTRVTVLVCRLIATSGGCGSGTATGSTLCAPRSLATAGACVVRVAHGYSANRTSGWNTRLPYLSDMGRMRRGNMRGHGNNLK